MQQNLSPEETVWRPLKRISWSAVFAGVLIAIIIQLLLSLLGVGIGMSSIDAVEEHNPVKGLGTGSVIWYAITSLIALFIGGWIAGRLAQTPRRFDAFLHGVLTWSVVTLITFYLLTTAVGNLIGGVGKLVGQTIGAAGNIAGKGIEMAAPKAGEVISQKLEKEGIDLGNLKQEANKLLRQTGKEELNPEKIEQEAGNVGDEMQEGAEQSAKNPQTTDESIENVIDNIFKKGKAAVSEIDREAAVNVIVARTGKTEEEANQIVTNWVNTYEQMQAKVQQAKEEAEIKAREAADATAKAISKAAFISFISLIIGCLIAAFGARMGNDSKYKIS